MKFPFSKDFSAIYVLAVVLLCALVFGDSVLSVKDKEPGRKTPPALPLRSPCWDAQMRVCLRLRRMCEPALTFRSLALRQRNLF